METVIDKRKVKNIAKVYGDWLIALNKQERFSDEEILFIKSCKDNLMTFSGVSFFNGYLLGMKEVNHG